MKTNFISWLFSNIQECIIIYLADSLNEINDLNLKDFDEFFKNTDYILARNKKINTELRLIKKDIIELAICGIRANAVIVKTRKDFEEYKTFILPLLIYYPYNKIRYPKNFIHILETDEFICC